jgi:protease IV
MKDEKLKDAKVVRYTDAIGFGSLLNLKVQKLIGTDNEMTGIMEILSRPNSPRLMYLYAE